MAVTLTVAQLAAALRLGDSAEETAEATRLLAYASEAVVKQAPGATDTAHDEASVRLCGYLFDQPNAARGMSFAHAGRNSGAWAILLPYRIHRAGSTGEAIADAQQAVGTPGNPVIGVNVDSGNLVVTFTDGATTTQALPAGMGGSGTDQTARDAADAAQASAAAAQASADAAQTTADDNTNTISSLPTPADWAEDGNPNPVPDDKISTSIRGHRVFIQTSVPASGIEGDVWIRDATTTHPSLYEHNGNAFQLDYSFFGSRVHFQTFPLNVALSTPAANRGDLLFELISGTLTIYRRVDTTPFWVSIGTVTGGGGGTSLSSGALAPFVEAYALLGTSAKINAGRLPDIPFSLLDGTLEPWTDQNSTAQIDDARLPPARLVPDPSSATDGQVAKVQGGAWTIGDDAEGTPGSVDLTANTVASLPRAPDVAVHSRAIFAGVFDSDIFRYEFGHLIRLMRSTAGLGRQINPGGNSGNLGKVPVVHADGGDFHYLLQNPVELPSIASNAPTNTALMNPAIIYKDSSPGATANGLFYKRRHDRESVIIAMNDTSPRSFGTEHRSFGWTSRIILDTAEPVPGVSPYPEAPTHWEAFIRSQNIASGLLEWRLYTDQLFTTLDTIYLDMRDQDDPDTHIQNAAMTKPINEAYWTTGPVAFGVFPFYGISGRLSRPVIRIRNADDTLSTSIIHLIPTNDVREALVDEDRLHDVYADILDIIEDKVKGVVRSLLYNQNFNYSGANTYAQLAAPGVIAPAVGLGAVWFGGAPVKTQEVLTFDWSSLPTLADGASSSGLAGFHSLGGGNYSFSLARTSSNHVMLAAPNAGVDPSPLKIWDLG